MHTVMVIGGGSTVAEELPISLVVFGVPAAIAAVFWWRFGRGH